MTKSPQHPPGRLFPIVRKCVAIALLSLLLGEVALRVVNHFKPSYVFYNNRYTRFRGRPFSQDWDFQLNSRGFKDLEFSEEKTTQWRVLGIGDSFAFGVVPYQWNYHTVLEGLLNERGHDVEILNMGIPSIGPKEYLDVLMREGLALNPDCVLVSFFVGNDFSELPSLTRNRRAWYEYSFVASLVRYILVVEPNYEGQSVHGASTTYQDEAPAFSIEAFLEIEEERSFICRRESKRLKKLLHEAVAYLDKMQAICERQGIGFVVALIPDECQVNEKLQEQLMTLTFTEESPDEWDWEQPTRWIAEELERRGTVHINLYQPFRDGSQLQRLYRVRDTHWNIAGNQLAADVIGDGLESYLTDSQKD